MYAEYAVCCKLAVDQQGPVALDLKQGLVEATMPDKQ